MAWVWLVRHGEADAAWPEGDADPGLSALGREQAQAAAQVLSGLGATRILSSPMRRCRETAAPFSALSGLPVTIEPRVTEIASPSDVPQEGRRDWLRAAFAGTWDEIQGGDFVAWRDAVAAAVAGAADAVVFTHFVAINAALSAATGSQAVVVRRPANTALVVFETDGARLTLIDGGREAEGAVL